MQKVKKSNVWTTTATALLLACSIHSCAFNAQTSLGKGKALPSENKYSKAADELSVAIAAEPHNVDALAARARAYTELGRLQQALSDLNAATALEAKNAKLYLQRAKCFRKLNQLDKAHADAEKAISINPQLAESYDEKNAIANDLRLETAMNYNLSLSTPANPETVSQRAEWFEKMHDSQGALLELNKAVEAHPDNVHIRESRAHILLSTMLAVYFWNRVNRKQRLSSLLERWR